MMDTVDTVGGSSAWGPVIPRAFQGACHWQLALLLGALWCPLETGSSASDGH